MTSAVLVVMGCLFLGASGWGYVGHEITAKIGSVYLNAGIVSEVSSLLSDFDGSMEKAAPWADEVKRHEEYRWSANLHFGDTDDWQCGYDLDRDCPDGRCVVTALANYTKRVAVTGAEQSEALKFVIHFTGDMHQPLHTGFRSNKGGNTWKGTFMGEECNLHEVWDGKLIQKRMDDDFGGDQEKFTQHLIDRSKGDLASKVTEWMSCSHGCELAWTR